MPANEAVHTIDHHDLAVIAEVDLEAVEPAAARGEGADLHAAFAQGLAVACGQGVAADTIVEHIDFHAFSGLLQQQRLELPPEVIVMNDEEVK